MKPWHLMTALSILLATGLAGAAPGPDELVMSRTAQVLGSGGSGRYQLEVTVKLEAGTNVAASLTALAVEETLPTGWVYESVTATPPPATVNPVAGNTYQFVWVTLPNLSSPFVFKYLVDYPTGASGEVIVGQAPFRTGGGQLASNTVTTPENAISCLTMTRAVPQYTPNGDLIVQVTLDSFCGEPVTALAVEETWPAGWTFVSATGAGASNPNLAPPVGTQGTLQFIWFSPIPTFPCNFSYTVKAPVVVSGPVTVTGQSIARLSGPELRTPLLDSITEPSDTTPPVITLNGANPLTLECGTAYVEPGATALDNIDGAITPTISGTVNSAVPGQYTITYSATDLSGNTGTATRIVNVLDRIAPVITLLGSTPLTVQCGTGYLDAGATASDTCAGDLTSSIVVTNPVNMAVVGAYTVRYNVSDGNGNNAVEVTRSVIVLDTTRPVITLLGSTPVTVQCGTAYIDAGATASDACDGDLTGGIVPNNVVNTAAVGTYSVTYFVADSHGNSAIQVIRTVNVVDTIAPVITLSGSNPVTVQCGTPYVDAGATASDSCAGNLTASIVVTNPVANPAVAGTYTVRYNVNDGNGNSAVEVTRTVNVVDTTAPVITLLGSNPATVQCGGTYTDAGATASDTCAGDRTSSIVVTNPVAKPAVSGTYTVRYNVNDGNGNSAVEVTRTVHVVDTTAPVITLHGSATVSIGCGQPYTELGASALDTCVGNLSASVTVSGTVNTSVAGSYLLTYNVSDPTGNAAAPVTRTVTVTDSIAPAITLNGSATVTVECGHAYTELGAAALDACAGDLSLSVTITGFVNTSLPGIYVLTYHVSDPSGNAAAPVTRTVTVGDTAGPVIVLNGTSVMSVECGSTFTDPRAVATDACEGDVSRFLTVQGTVNSAIAGVYTLTYSAHDSRGFNAVPVTRTVTVADTSGPVIVLNGTAVMSVECGSTFTDPRAVASDVCEGDVSRFLTVQGTVNSAVVGVYTLTYSAHDSKGFNAAPVTRMVTVADTTRPVITLNGSASVTILCGDGYTELGASALDACAGDLSSAVTVSGTVNTSMAGDYLVTYNVADPSGNHAVQVTRTVHVTDNVPPVIALNGDSTITLECGATFTDPGAVATDACEGDVSRFLTVQGTVNTTVAGTYTLTYSAHDSSGNQAEPQVRTVVVGGPSCIYCPMTDIVFLRPPAKVLIPSTVAQAFTVISSEVLFANSADCIQGTVQVSYTVNGTEYLPTSDRAHNFPITLLLVPGDYTVRADATLLETGQVQSSEKTFSVVSVAVGANGYPLAPFTTVTPDGTSFSNMIHANGFNRSIEMVAALCPEDGGSTEDVTMTINYDGDQARTLTVTVPRAVVPCGSQALLTVTVSDSIEGLAGDAEAPFFAPVPDGFIPGGLFFDISILVASLPDVANGGAVPYAEIDNSVIAAHPVSMSLSGLTFSPNVIPTFLSHPSSFAPGGTADMNLLGETAVWSDTDTMGFMVEGDTLQGKATSLSVFAPFETEQVLSFSPDIKYGVIFGRAVIHTSIDKVFTVTNNGSVRASGMADISFDENGVFSVVGDGSYSLAAGESFALTVRFTPKAVKDCEGVLSFTGVPNTNLSVRVLGTGTLGPKKKFLSILSCAPVSQDGPGADLLALAAAVGLLAAGRLKRYSRRHS